MRGATWWIAVACIVALAAACGGTHEARLTPVGSASSAPSASPSNSAQTLTLTADEVPPPVTGSLHQQSDELYRGEANTDVRVFADTRGSVEVEIDVLPDTSAAAATDDYPAVRDLTRTRVTSLTASASPDIGDQSDEFSGTTADGRTIVALSFQEGSVLCAVLVLSASITPDPAYVESVAAAQDQKIANAT